MTAPAAKLSVTQRDLLKDMVQPSAVVPSGRVMLCKGRHIVGYDDVAALAHPKTLQHRGADTVCVSRADYDDITEWMRS